MSGGWNTIESDAGVFTHLVEKLGVKNVQFEELISLDEDTIRSLSPVYGVIFLFKYPTAASTSQPERDSRAAGVPVDGTFDHAASESHFFASQVIQNACGTQALLSVLLNKDDTASSTSPPSTQQQQAVDIGPTLSAFKTFTQPLPPDMRGESLSNSDLIREVHNSFARASPFVDETSRPDVGPDDDADVYHFIAYTQLAGQLYELDGLQQAPISHGACASEAELPARLVEVLQRRMQRYRDGEIRFNLLAMVRDPRPRMREVGDAEGLAREASKRRAWAWENALRKHNFLGFVKELLTEVARAKVEAGTFGEWVEGAKAATSERVEGRRKRRQGGDGMQIDG